MVCPIATLTLKMLPASGAGMLVAVLQGGAAGAAAACMGLHARDVATGLDHDVVRATVDGDVIASRAPAAGT